MKIPKKKEDEVNDLGYRLLHCGGMPTSSPGRQGLSTQAPVVMIDSEDAGAQRESNDSLPSTVEQPSGQRGHEEERAQKKAEELLKKEGSDGDAEIPKEFDGVDVKKMEEDCGEEEAPLELQGQKKEVRKPTTYSQMPDVKMAKPSTSSASSSRAEAGSVDATAIFFFDLAPGSKNTFSFSFYDHRCHI